MDRLGAGSRGAPPRPGGAARLGRTERSYDWLVVGAGPAGLAAVGKLLDNGVAGGSICWVDPLFSVGDLGLKWKGVSSNTKAHLFRGFLRGCASFGYEVAEQGFALEALGGQEPCLLEDVVEPLQWVTDRLMSKVCAVRSEVTELRWSNNSWMALVGRSEVRAGNVILAIGAEPLSLGYSLPAIGLEDALDLERVKGAVGPEDVVAVFGSSHSAMMAVHNLTDAGVRRVINFYRTPLRYAVDYGSWILYDNTGLKGVTAEWTRRTMGTIPKRRLLRVRADDQNISKYLSQCSKVVYGVGFKARTLDVQGADLAHYDPRTGVIAPGLYGCGIAFPERVVDRTGNVEYNVGIWKFIQYLDRVVPTWIHAEAMTKEPSNSSRAAVAPIQP